MANINPTAGGVQSHYAHSGVTPPQGQANPPDTHNYGQTTHTGSTTGTPPAGQAAQGPQGQQGSSQNSHRGQNVNTTA